MTAILHSKRANVYYLEHCRVLVRGGRVEFATTEENRQDYWNIPIANTTFLLLGNGTSVTQAAMRMLAGAGVVVGFCGGGGTPLYAAVDPLWVTPQGDYRATGYMQQWMRMWLDDGERLKAAKLLQERRLSITEKWWGGRHLQEQGFQPTPLDNLADNFERALPRCKTITEVLSLEGNLTKALYSTAAAATGQGNFKRDQKSLDQANQFLNHGNYLAYGCGAVTTWVLGLHPGLAVLHGKTRRGGLVFDFADIVKDGVILPQAFLSAKQGHSQKEFRQKCLQHLMSLGALQTMFDTAKEIASLGSPKP